MEGKSLRDWIWLRIFEEKSLVSNFYWVHPWDPVSLVDKPYLSKGSLLLVYCSHTGAFPNTNRIIQLTEKLWKENNKGSPLAARRMGANLDSLLIVMVVRC